MPNPEPMVVIQGKVPRNIKQRIKILIQQQEISESEFLRRLTEDYLNGNQFGESKTDNSSELAERLQRVESQVDSMKRSLFFALELILTNVTDEPEKVSAVLAEFRQHAVS